MSTMPADTIVELLAGLQAEDFHVWIDGGWAVDALLGVETRLHRDLDVVVQEKDVSGLRRMLEDYGYAERVDDETKPWNFVMADGEGHEVDIHVIALDSDGNGIYGPLEFGVSYPTDSLTGHGFIGGYLVFCISPEWLVRFHTGYEIDEEDVRDVLALHERFGVPLPEEYIAFIDHTRGSHGRDERASEQLVDFTPMSMLDDARGILGAAMYRPTSERIEILLSSVYAESDTRLFGLVMGESVVGVMGIRLDSQSVAEILHIAVDEGNRGKGYGRQLIELVVQEEALTGLYAETDRDAVGFYQRCGFSIESLGEKYPGIERFQCRWVKGEDGRDE